MLDSNKDNLKLEAMKRIIGVILFFLLVAPNVLHTKNNLLHPLAIVN